MGHRGSKESCLRRFQNLLPNGRGGWSKHTKLGSDHFCLAPFSLRYQLLFYVSIYSGQIYQRCPNKKKKKKKKKSVVPLASIAFMIGRILFIIGYGYGAPAR